MLEEGAVIVDYLLTPHLHTIQSSLLQNISRLKNVWLIIGFSNLKSNIHLLKKKCKKQSQKVQKSLKK